MIFLREQVKNSSQTLHRNINLIELQQIASNKSQGTKSATSINKYSEPSNSLNIVPIKEDNLDFNFKQKQAEELSSSIHSSSEIQNPLLSK